MGQTSKLVPVSISQNEGMKMQTTEPQVMTTSFGEWGLKEDDIEVFLEENMHLLLNEDGTNPSLQVVGRQVRNEFGGKCDLIAIDSTGAIVVVEIKRDPKDCKARVEAFEMQAIRYASSFTRIETPDDLARQVFGPYLQKYKKDEIAGKDAYDHARRQIELFLDGNVTFNQKQKIILIASGFNHETISACAWLRKNGIDITCIRISPMTHVDKNFLLIERILPPPELADMLGSVGDVIISRNTAGAGSSAQRSGRAKFMTTAEMIERGLLKKGDAVVVKGYHGSTATVEDHRTVIYKNRPMSWNEWAKSVTEWSAVNIYANVLKEGRSLDDIRTSAQEILDRENDIVDTGEEQ